MQVFLCGKPAANQFLARAFLARATLISHSRMFHVNFWGVRTGQKLISNILEHSRTTTQVFLCGKPAANQFLARAFLARATLISRGAVGRKGDGLVDQVMRFCITEWTY